MASSNPNSRLPLDVFPVETPVAGKCHVPCAFKDELVKLIAAGDWVRTFTNAGNAPATVRELRAMAVQARAIASLADDFADGIGGKSDGQ
jgi:hypothetical protein